MALGEQLQEIAPFIAIGEHMRSAQVRYLGAQVGAAPEPAIGSTPWSVPGPVVMDMSKAADKLGYRPRAAYTDAVKPAVQWMIDVTAGRDWRDVFPYFLCQSRR